MGLAYKDLSMKSDFSHMPPSRSAFDSEYIGLCTDLNESERSRSDVCFMNVPNNYAVAKGLQQEHPVTCSISS